MWETLFSNVLFCQVVTYTNLTSIQGKEKPSGKKYIQSNLFSGNKKCPPSLELPTNKGFIDIQIKNSVKHVFLGVLVTGGVSNNDATERRVELIDFNKEGVWTCPELPFNFFAHTQDTLPDNKVLLCGGFDTSTRNFCYQMKKGTFPSKPVHQFRTRVQLTRQIWHIFYGHQTLCMIYH